MKYLILVPLAVVAVGCVAAGRAHAADAADVAKANNKFAFDLYGKLAAEKGNLFLSPYSISTALTMTSAGARGDTLAEMAKTLRHPLEGDKLHAAFGELMKQINGGDAKKRGYQLSTANALWGQKGYPFREPFLKLTNDFYGAGLREVDFVGDTEKSRETINKWVEKETNDKIKDLLKKGVVKQTTRLVLTNAIYFKGDWASQFKKDVTKDEPFFRTADDKVNVPLMSQQGKFKYHETDAVQVLELPYVGKELSMVVVLPKKKGGLGDVEKGLTAEAIDGWVGKGRERLVAVTLPKFKVTAEFSLNQVLSDMGMPKAFTPAADLKGIADVQEELWIHAVVHKAFVDVNEEGTEAAAATGVVVGTRSAPQVETFRADHPFLFLIRDNRSGSVLFMGRLVDPK